MPDDFNHTPRTRTIASPWFDGKAKVQLGTGPASRCVVPRVGAIPVRSVELEVSDAVEYLDLSPLTACQHVLVRGGARLKHLWMRKGVSDVTLTLALSAAPSLMIEGQVTELDACWPGSEGSDVTRFQFDGRRRAPSNRIWLGVTVPRTPAEVVLLHGLAGVEELDLRSLPDLSILDLRSSDVHTVHLQAVHRLLMQDCSRLESVLATVVGTVAIRRCARVRYIRAEGQVLELRVCNQAGELVVDGTWSVLVARTCSWGRLVARDVKKVKLRDVCEVDWVVGAHNHAMSVKDMAVPHAPRAGWLHLESEPEDRHPEWAA